MDYVQSKYCRPGDGVWYCETEVNHPTYGKVRTIRPFAPGQRWARTGATGLKWTEGPFTLKQIQGAMWTAADDSPGTVWVDMAVEALDLSRPGAIRPYVFLGWSDQVASTNPTSYPSKCPRCGSPAYLGAVPTALDCSNDKCPSKTKGGGIRK